jgi:hypothetical protein
MPRIRNDEHDHKGQMYGVGKGDILDQVMFIAGLFEVAS